MQHEILERRAVWTAHVWKSGALSGRMYRWVRLFPSRSVPLRADSCLRLPGAPRRGVSMDLGPYTPGLGFAPLPVPKSRALIRRRVRGEHTCSSGCTAAASPLHLVRNLCGFESPKVAKGRVFLAVRESRMSLLAPERRWRRRIRRKSESKPFLRKFFVTDRFPLFSSR